MPLWDNKPDKVQFPSMDTNLMQQLANMGTMKMVLVVLLLVICSLFILQAFRIRSVLKDAGMKRSLENVKGTRKTDKYIANANRFLYALSEIVKLSPFALAPYKKEYLSYNLQRAKTKVPGGFRLITADEWNALICFIQIVMVILSLLIGIIFNPFVGIGFAIGSIIIMSYLPFMMIRSNVTQKDIELQTEFPEFYLMLHYALITGGKSPIGKVMKSYSAATNSEELKSFIDNSCEYIETYGESLAMAYIAKDYREVAEVAKLTRLIKQLYDGADVRQDLIGFRNKLIDHKKYLINKKMNKLIARAQFSFNLLWIILIQAIISAMGIYVPDIMGGSALLGG